MKTLGERLKNLRQSNELTQSELAEKLEISASAVGMYEQNRREPDNTTLLKICRLFSVSTDYLLDGDDQPREVNDFLSNVKNQMKMTDGLMFNGVPLSSDDKEKLFDAMIIAANVMFNDKKKES